MFGAQEIGALVGGSFALLVSRMLGYPCGVLFVCGLVAVVFRCVTCQPWEGRAAGAERCTPSLYFATLFEALFRWQVWVACVFALCPGGARLLGGPHSVTWMRSHGLEETEVAQVEIISRLMGVAGTLLGGFISSKAGPRPVVAFSYASTSLVSLAVLTLTREMEPWSVGSWIILKAIYHLFIGLHVAPQMELFMRSCKMEQAATQVTIFCCLCNNADAWCKSFHGQWIDEEGNYFFALEQDAAFGMLALLLLPWVG